MQNENDQETICQFRAPQLFPFWQDWTMLHEAQIGDMPATLRCSSASARIHSLRATGLQAVDFLRTHVKRNTLAIETTI